MTTMNDFVVADVVVVMTVLSSRLRNTKDKETNILAVVVAVEVTMMTMITAK